MIIADLHDGGLGARIAAAASHRTLGLERRRFPDGESYIRVLDPVRGERIWLVASLADPNRTLIPVLLLAATLREQGAATVGLVAPYLPYMRQDIAFQPGECVSARHVAELLGGAFDALLTVDAHLHRIRSLSELLSIPAQNLSAAPLLGDWIRANVPEPLLIGPDSESGQWVEAAAARIGCPWITLAKNRHGDREVSVKGLMDPAWRALRPVLVDDMISTGATLIAACELLRRDGFSAPAVAVVHGLFAEDAADRLRRAGAGIIASSDSIPHPSNAIALASLFAAAIQRS